MWRIKDHKTTKDGKKLPQAEAEDVSILDCFLCATGTISFCNFFWDMLPESLALFLH